MTSIRQINDDGAIHYYNEAGEYHRIDGPAIIRLNGSEEWLINGRHHRTDGPAYIGSDGAELWVIEGETHREDGPAVKWADGRLGWYINNKLHRIDGPAFMNNNHFKRSDRWYINNIDITDEAEEWMKENSISYPFDEEIKVQFKLRFL